MIINTVGGGGGTTLNFRVVNGTTQPVTAKENDIWVNTSTKIASYDFAAEMPCLRSNNKNKIVYPFYQTTQSVNGIDWTDNGNGTVSATGTASGASVFRLSAFDVDIEYLWLEAGTYTLSGCPSGGSASTYLMEVFILNPVTGNNESKGKDYGNGLTFTVEHSCKARINLNVIKGASVSNIVFKPQLEKGSNVTSFIKGDATGQVWFNVGTSCSAPINTVKKNSLMIYPTACQQFVNGAWVNKEAKTYQNATWVDWSVFIIVDGVMLINLDVLNAEWNGNSGNGGNNTTVTQKDGYVSVKGSKTGWGAAYTKCNMSGKTTVKVEGTLASGDATYQLLAVWSAIDPNYVGKNIIKSIALTSTGATLDVSSLSEEAYVGVTTVYTGEYKITQFTVE